MRVTKLARRVCVPADVAVTRACQVSYRRQRHGCWGSRKPCGAALARCLVLAQSTNGGESGGTAAERGVEQSGLCKHAAPVEAITCQRCRFSQKVAGVGDIDDTGPLCKSIVCDYFLLFNSMTSCGDCRSKSDDMREN